MQIAYFVLLLFILILFLAVCIIFIVLSVQVANEKNKLNQLLTQNIKHDVLIRSNATSPGPLLTNEKNNSIHALIKG